METKLEYILTNTYKAEMISYMKSNPEAVAEAIDLAISDKQPYAWRAAWLLWSFMEENDSRVKGRLNEIVKALPSKNDNHLRELLKILELMELDENQEGVLFDICVDIWEKVNKKPSVRFSAFKIITKIAKNHSELSQEISFLTRNQYMEKLSETVKKSIYKMVDKARK